MVDYGNELEWRQLASLFDSYHDCEMSCIALERPDAALLLQL